MLRQVSVTELIARPSKPVPWVCDGVAARGCLTILAGRPGEVKSWLALGLAQGVAENRTVAGIPCAFGSALYLDAEYGEAEMARRTRLLGARSGLDFYFPDGPFDFEENVVYLATVVGMQNPSLVVVDGFRSTWDGDENDSRAVTQALTRLVEIAKDYDVAIVLLHHMSKTGGYRGTGAIAAVPQVVIEIEADGPHRVMRWEKCRIGPAPFQHKFSIEGGTDSVRLVAR
jgi:predicted ATP-dependent serine protease